MLPPTTPPTTGPQWRPMRITTGLPSGAVSVAHRRCISTARRASASAFSWRVAVSPGTQPVDAMKASLVEGGGGGRGGEATVNGVPAVIGPI